MLPPWIFYGLRTILSGVGSCLMWWCIAYVCLLSLHISFWRHNSAKLCRISARITVCPGTQGMSHRHMCEFDAVINRQSQSFRHEGTRKNLGKNVLIY